MASANERNTLTVDRTSSGEVQFSDAATPMVAGLFCLPIPLGQALCDPDGDARDTDGGGVSVGGTGADVTAATGLCCATSYEDHAGGVRVSLDGKPNDGAAGRARRRADDRRRREPGTGRHHR